MAAMHMQAYTHVPSSRTFNQIASNTGCPFNSQLPPLYYAIANAAQLVKEDAELVKV